MRTPSASWSADADLIWHPGDDSTLHVKVGYTKANGNTEQQPFYEGAPPGAFTSTSAEGCRRFALSESTRRGHRT